MDKNKKAAIVASVVMVFIIALGASLYFTSAGKNLFAYGKSFMVSSWNSVAGEDASEIIDSSADISDDFSSSSGLLSQNDDVIEKNLPVSGASLPASAPRSDAVENDPQETKNIPVPEENNVDTIPSPPVAMATPVCKFPSTTFSPPAKIILNEIAWMGSPPSSGENNSDAGKEEWIELKNISSGTISLAGWQVADSSGKIRIIFNADDSIASGGFAVLARGASSSLPGSFPTTEFYSATLGNSGDTVAVIDPSCDASDILNAATGWPGGNNATKQTLERDGDHIGWHTSVNAGGTPGVENSIPVVSFTLSVSVAGDGHGTVASSPSGISCGTGNCTSVFASGTAISLAAAPDNTSIFQGWTGACSGTDPCSLYIEGPETVSAMFKAVLPAIPVEEPIIDDPSLPQPTSTQTVPIPVSTSTISQGHPVIAAVQIAGASSTNDIVKIFNPLGSSMDVSGWRLRKRSSTGGDGSIKVFPDNTTIPALGYFVWANSSGGFSETVGANVSSTETISADNSVALLDASGTVIDALAWGKGTAQYGEGAAFPTDPDANQFLTRVISAGTMVDTNNNAADFVLQ